VAANRRGSGILAGAPRSSAAAARARTIVLSWPVLLAAILALALGLRLYHLDWDQGHHLHPDERFISFVEAGTDWPPSFRAYFETQYSPLNPNRGASYSYGTFPLFLGKAVADVTGHSGFDDSYLVGRALTALFDTGTVLLVFAIGSLLWSRRVGLLAALLSALCVLQIQLAHFWTVDPYLTFFSTATLYLSIRIARSGGIASYLLCGAAIGLGLASKVTALTLVVLPVAAVAIRVVTSARGRRTAGRIRSLLGTGLLGLIGCGAAGFAVFRIAQPYAFTGPHIWDIGLDGRFLDVLREQRLLTSGNAGYPPFVQWAEHAGYLFPLENILLWGLGLPLGIAAVAGVVYGGYRLFRLGDTRPVLPLVLAITVLAVYGGRFVAFARYFEPAYPALVLLAAVVLVRAWALRRRPRLRMLGLVAPAVVILTAAWAFAFLHVYRAPLTRIDASRWIYAHVPPGSRIMQESWDDGLPLGLGGASDPSVYRFTTFDPYPVDTREKVSGLVRRLDRADYVVLSSDRARKAIPRIRAQFPATTRYYRALDDGSLGFDLVSKFSSPPQLFGFRIPDDWAEESLSVYDHPVVRIYRKTPRYDDDRARALLMAARPERAVTLTPRQGDYNGLLETDAQAREQQQSGSWKALFGTKTGVGRYSPGNVIRDHPLLAWIFVLELLSLAVVPLLFLVLPSLPDRGYALAKPLGLLLLAFPVWLGVSLGLFSFSPAAVLACAIGLLGAGTAAAVLRRSELKAFFARAWPYVVAAELVFLGVFMAFYALRVGDPDLWHPARGGEKPMDFAYLNAVVKSTTLPPYDPWFGGGYLNYYYFGQFMTAVLIKPLGIAPEVAYNLAVPMFAALVAAATLSLAYNLVVAAGARLRPRLPRPPAAAMVTSVLAVVLVLGVGNLDPVRQWSRRLQEVDTWHLAAGTWFPGRFLAAVGGLWNWLVHGAALPPFDWWGSSRVIPQLSAITEFPFFTFLFADLHAHMMALPLAITATALALALVLAGADKASLHRRVAILCLLGLVIGSLRATNTWDFPTQLVVGVVAALGCVWLVHRRLSWPAVRAALGHVALLLAVAWLLFLPFTLSFQQFAGGIERSPGTTGPQDYLLQFGLFLVLATGLVGARLSVIAPRLARRTIAMIALSAVALIGVVFVASQVTQYGTAVMLAAGTGLVVALAVVEARRSAPVGLLVTYGLLALALLVSLGVELFRVQNDIDRQNTVFKFYLQIWWLLAIVGAVGAWVVWDVLRRRRAEHKLGRRAATAAAVWGTAAALLFAGAALYPASAVAPREADRFHTTPWTPDGMAYMPAARYTDDHGTYDLGRDYRAILWVRDHVRGSPIIMEGVTPVYGWGNRFAVYTGLPAVVGWDVHQGQQRLAYSDQVTERRADVDSFYNTHDGRRARQILRRYDVRYVVVGELERRYYDHAGLAKIPRLSGISRVYDRAGVQIYRFDGRAESAL
jgi:YYY domain-containing protein